MTQTSLSPRAVLLLLLLALIWGGSFTATAVALTELPVRTVVALRVGGAAVVLWLYVLTARLPMPRDLRTWVILLSLGLIGNALPFSLITFGQTTVPSGLAAILNAATAVFGVLVAAAFFRDERLTVQKVTGVTLGIAGVAVAMGVQSLLAFDPTALGQLALIGASLSYAFTGALGKVALRSVVAPVAATGMMTGAALVMIPLALATDGLPAPHHSGAVWLALAYSAVIATALAYILYYRLLGRIGAGNTSFVTLLVAPVAIVLGAVLLQESLPLRAYLGFLLLAAGLVVLDGRLLARGPKAG